MVNWESLTISQIIYNYLSLFESNPDDAKVLTWKDLLKEFSKEEVLEAFKWFTQNKQDNEKPEVSKIIRIIKTKREEKRKATKQKNLQDYYDETEAFRNKLLKALEQKGLSITDFMMGNRMSYKEKLQFINDLEQN